MSWWEIDDQVVFICEFLELGDKLDMLFGNYFFGMGV